MSELIENPYVGYAPDALADMANNAAENIESAKQDIAHNVVQAGQALLAAKEQCQHGEWLSWLEENFKFTRRHAQRYMEIASNATRVSFSSGDSIRGMLQQLAELKAEEKQDLAPPEDTNDPMPVDPPAETDAYDYDEDEWEEDDDSPDSAELPAEPLPESSEVIVEDSPDEQPVLADEGPDIIDADSAEVIEETTVPPKRKPQEIDRNKILGDFNQLSSKSQVWVFNQLSQLEVIQGAIRRRSNGEHTLTMEETFRSLGDQLASSVNKLQVEFGPNSNGRWRQHCNESVSEVLDAIQMAKATMDRLEDFYKGIVNE